MSRIPQEDLTKLKTASEVAGVASTAKTELEEMQVAHCINTAANTGETSAVYCHPISDTLMETLKSKGYTIAQPYPMAKRGDEYIIIWKDAE